jgi:methylmalonyl-CoA mutase C-terminal domain/subunit
MDNVNVVAGGIIPDDDIPELGKIGVKAVFGPGTPTTEIAGAIEKLVRGTG